MKNCWFSNRKPGSNHEYFLVTRVAGPDRQVRIRTLLGGANTDFFAVFSIQYVYFCPKDFLELHIFRIKRIFVI